MISQRQVGRRSLSITTLGFGGAPIGNLYTPVADADAAAAVQAAYQAGVRYFDTAPLYGYGLSERRIGDALRTVPRASFVLSTKVGRRLVPEDPSRWIAGQFPESLPFRIEFDYSYDGAIRSIEASLERLRLGHIDIALIHDVDMSTHGTEDATATRFREAMSGAYLALDRLRSEKTIGAIGCGVNEWLACERFARAGDFDCFLLAGRYTLLEQEALDTFLPLCEQRQISVIVGGPYNTGILATGAVADAFYNYQPAPAAIVERVKRIEAVCQRHKVPLPAAALQFPLGHPQVSAVIPGARSIAEVRRNVEFLTVRAPAVLWRDLKAEGLLRVDAPVPD